MVEVQRDAEKDTAPGWDADSPQRSDPEATVESGDSSFGRASWSVLPVSGRGFRTGAPQSIKAALPATGRVGHQTLAARRPARRLRPSVRPSGVLSSA